MNVLYIGPTTPTSSINGGYEFIANSFNTLFTKLKEDGEIENYTVVDINTKANKIELCATYDIGIILTHPKSFENPNLRTNIENLRRHCSNFYINVFWETDPLPSDWDWMFQTNLFTGFIACSDFVKDLLQQKVDYYKLSQRVCKVYPLIEKFNTKIDIDKKKDEDRFTVLYVGQYTKRKGMEDAIISFSHALGQKEDCQLYLKYHRLSKLEFDDVEFIKRTSAMNCKNMIANIYSVTEDLNRESIYNLYKESSVLLFPSRGEGFGLPLLEASIIGLPIIYADNSSCNEVVDGMNLHRVPCIKDIAIGMSQYGYESSSYYGVPIMSHMIKALNVCYEQWKNNREEYYRTNNGKMLIKKYSKENILKQLKQLKELY